MVEEGIKKRMNQWKKVMKESWERGERKEWTK